MKTLVKEWLKAAFAFSVADGGVTAGWGVVTLILLALAVL